MLRSDLRTGDVLLLEDTPDNTTVKHKGIRFGQRLTSAKVWRKNKGKTKYVHAVIWIGKHGVDMAEASGSGSVRKNRLPYGTYRVYQCDDRSLAELAASTALLWADGGTIGYSKPKAVYSVFHSDGFGTQGQARALNYAADINNSQPAWGADGAFCSQFIVACYQAAALHANNNNVAALQGDFLQCDAKHCSVRALHDRLFRDSNFRLIGDLDYDEKAIATHYK